MELRQCPECKREFELGQKFCPNCGCNLEENYIENPVCPICHRTYSAGTTYCSADGTKLTSPEKMIPKCIICGTAYDANTRYCPKDGGVVMAEALRYKSGNSKEIFRGYKKAPNGLRFLAYLLDGFISALLSIPSIFLYVIGLANLESSSSYYHDSDSGSAVIFFLFAAILYIIPLLYSLLKDGIGNGQSFGKRAVGLMVIIVPEERACSYGSSFVRNIIGGLISLIPIVGWLIEPLMVLCTDDGRRIGDKAANTKVVELLK